MNKTDYTDIDQICNCAARAIINHIEAETGCKISLQTCLNAVRVIEGAITRIQQRPPTRDLSEQERSHLWKTITHWQE